MIVGTFLDKIEEFNIDPNNKLINNNNENENENEKSKFIFIDDNWSNYSIEQKIESISNKMKLLINKWESSIYSSFNSLNNKNNKKNKLEFINYPLKSKILSNNNNNFNM